MADAEPQRQMSLIPYTSDSQEIVLYGYPYTLVV